MKKFKKNDLTEILKPYLEKDLWVALNSSQTEVIAIGKTLKEAFDNAKKITDEKPVLMRTKQDYFSYAPNI
jgi:ribosomal protein L5